jgi:hypothetical protein
MENQFTQAETRTVATIQHYNISNIYEQRMGEFELRNELNERLLAKLTLKLLSRHSQLYHKTISICFHKATYLKQYHSPRNLCAQIQHIAEYTKANQGSWETQHKMKQELILGFHLIQIKLN